MNTEEVIQYPLATEKSIKLMESENKLIFVVNKKATKPDVKKALETEFNVKVKNVKTAIDTKGRKKAYVQFTEESPALEIATKLGLM